MFRSYPTNLHRISSVNSAINIHPIAPLSSQGIMRDPESFSTLKDENNTVQTQAHGVFSDLGGKCKPMTQDEMVEFEEEMKYLKEEKKCVVNMLSSKVETDDGTSLDKEHESNVNARSVNKKLCALLYFVSYRTCQHQIN